MDSKLTQSKRTVICPQCGSKNIATYFYGLPLSFEALQKKIDEGKIKMGGCSLTVDSPVHFCNECRKDF
jgi:Zn finger protein HypA/HybF involved in hydrogenase expression